MKKNEGRLIHIRGVVPLEGEPKGLKKNRKKTLVRVIVIAIALAIFLMGGTLLYMQTLTYTSVELIKTYTGVSVANSRCEGFASGILRFGKDGVSFLDDEGQAVWNYSYEISNPVVEMNSKSAVIADIGGNTIVVMDENGVKGEIETILPIEKVTVSEQGIVAALLQDDSTPQVICYDAVGNVLVEHKTSLSGTGYPMGIALSLDGTALLVTYLQVSDDGLLTNYVYYYFGDDDLFSGSEVCSGSRDGVVIPEVRFIDEETSIMISSDGIEIFKGIQEPVLTYEIEIDKEISSVFYGDEVFGVLLSGEAGADNEIRVYDTLGEIIVAQQYAGEYTNVDIIDDQIILYESYSCLIYSMQDVLKYEGDMTMEISGIFPIFGINKYVVVGDGGMDEIRLAR